MKRFIIAAVVGLVAVAVVASLHVSVSTPVTFAGPITPTGWRAPACSAGSGIVATGSGLLYQCAAISTRTNSAGSGYVPTTLDGSGDLGPSGIRDTGSGSTATIKFDNTPSGINGYGGIHFETNEEWITTPIDAPSTALPNTQPYLQADSWQLFSNLGFGCGETYPIDGVGRPGVQEFYFVATGGSCGPGYAGAKTGNPTFRTSAQTSTLEVAGGIASIGTTTTSSSLFMWLGNTDRISSSPHGCFWLYDPSNQKSFRAGTGTGTLTAVCANGASYTAYDLAGTGNCDGSFPRGTASIGAVTFPNTNVFHLGLIESSTEADFYTISGSTWTKVCQITSNLPPTTTGLATWQIVGSTVTSTATIKLDLDYTGLSWNLGSARSP